MRKIGGWVSAILSNIALQQNIFSKKQHISKNGQKNHDNIRISIYSQTVFLIKINPEKLKYDNENYMFWKSENILPPFFQQPKTK